MIIVNQTANLICKKILTVTTIYTLNKTSKDGHELGFKLALS